MKYFLYVVVVLFLSCFDRNSEKNYNSEILQNYCIPGFDSSILVLANEFKPTTIDLDKSISAKLFEFIKSADTNCLKQSKGFEIAVATILLKLYIYHLQCCGMGYDLHGMKKGKATILINEFERMAGFSGNQIEFINSFIIVDYIKKNEDLKNERLLKNYLRDVNRIMDSLKIEYSE